ncbi:MAG TPA: hypothetical protein VLA52_03440 [Thermohalobaculum sp.]|nr:hypothetical protein [Thermohalobaculum sp.]
MQIVFDFFLAYYVQILIYLATAFGAAGMYVFSDYKGFENSKSFLKRFFPGKATVFYDRSDFFLMVASGTIIGTICFSPINYYEALAAGFGWTGAMNVLMKAG